MLTARNLTFDLYRLQVEHEGFSTYEGLLEEGPLRTFHKHLILEHRTELGGLRPGDIWNTRCPTHLQPVELFTTP